MGGGSGDTAEPAWLRYDLVGDTRSGDTARQWAAGFPMNLVAADVTPEIDEVKLGVPYFGTTIQRLTARMLRGTLTPPREHWRNIHRMAKKLQRKASEGLSKKIQQP